LASHQGEPQGQWRRQDIRQIEVDHDESQYFNNHDFVQLGANDNAQALEQLHQMLMDPNTPAAERAQVQRRIINLNKPKTAGANRNHGKKKLSTVPTQIINNQVGSDAASYGAFGT